MILPSLKIGAAALAVGFAIGAGAGWSVKSWKEDAAKLSAERRAEEAEEREQNRANELAGLWAANSENIRADARDREAKLRRELEDARYRCPVPDSGGVLLDGAIEAANAARKPRSTVPGASEAGGKNGRRPPSP